MKQGLARLLLGQVVGQLCLVVAVPLLTRLMAPTELGLFQVASAVSVVLQPAATLCHEFRIPVATSESEVAALRRVGLAVLGGTTALCGAVGLGAVLAGAGTVAATSFTIALLLLAYAGTVLDNAVLIHGDRRSALAVRNLLAGVLGAGLQIAAAMLVGSAVALGAAVLVGRLVAIAATRRSMPTGTRGSAVLSVRTSLTAVGAQSVWVLSMQTLTLLATPFFGVVAAGYVGLAQRIAGAPTALIGQALGQVAQSLLAPHVRAPDGGLRRAVLRQTVALGGVAGVIALSLILLAPSWAGTLLGEQYAAVGTVTAVLAVPFALQITTGPLVPLLIMLDRQATLLRLQIVRAGAAVLAVVGGALLTGDFVATCVAYAVAETACYAACLVAILREATRWDVAHAAPGDPATTG